MKKQKLLFTKKLFGFLLALVMVCSLIPLMPQQVKAAAGKGANCVRIVSISESGSANGHRYIKCSYDNCVSAFGTSDFGNKLDQVHVSAKSGSITVYSVCYVY